MTFFRPWFKLISLVTRAFLKTDTEVFEGRRATTTGTLNGMRGTRFFSLRRSWYWIDARYHWIFLETQLSNNTFQEWDQKLGFKRQFYVLLNSASAEKSSSEPYIYIYLALHVTHYQSEVDKAASAPNVRNSFYSIIILGAIYSEGVFTRGRPWMSGLVLDQYGG